LIKIIPFLIHDNESGEVFHLDFSDGFHSQLFKIKQFDGFYVGFGQNTSGTADGAEVITTVFATGICNLLAADAFGQDDHRAAQALEFVHINLYAASGGRSEADDGIPSGVFAGSA